MARSIRAGLALGLGGMALVICGGCRRSEPPPAPPAPAVTVSRPVVQEVTDYGEYTGTTAAVETVDVRARVQGWLQAMYYVPDSIVQKDAPLFLIEPAQYQAALDVAKAFLGQQQASLGKARRDWERAQRLGPSEALAQAEYDAYLSAYEAAKAAVAAAEANVEQAQLNLGYTRVTSPIAGRVGRNQVDVGNLVGASSQPTVLATVVNDRQVYVYFSGSEADYLKYARTHGTPKEGGPSTRAAAQERPAYLGLSDEEGYPHKGYIDYVGVRVDPLTGTIRARAVFDDPGGILISGLFARIRVPLLTRRALVVPDVALQADQAGPFVLVVNLQDVVERRAVRTGQAVGESRVIEEGLTQADRVVVNGLQRARPGSTVRVTEAPAPAAAPAPTSQPEESGGQ